MDELDLVTVVPLKRSRQTINSKLCMFCQIKRSGSNTLKASLQGIRRVQEAFAIRFEQKGGQDDTIIERL